MKTWIRCLLTSWVFIYHRCTWSLRLLVTSCFSLWIDTNYPSWVHLIRARCSKYFHKPLQFLISTAVKFSKKHFLQWTLPITTQQEGDEKMAVNYKGQPTQNTSKDTVLFKHLTLGIGTIIHITGYTALR